MKVPIILHEEFDGVSKTPGKQTLIAWGDDYRIEPHHNHGSLVYRGDAIFGTHVKESIKEIEALVMKKLRQIHGPK